MKIIDQLKKEFYDNKLNTELIADINLKNAMLNDDFKKSYNLIKSLQFDLAKAQYENKDSSKLKNDILNEKNNLHNICKKLKLDTSTLKPNYNCNKCKDLGFVNGSYCDCFKKALSIKLLENSGLNYSNLPDFDNMSYDIVKNPQQKEQYVKVCDVLKQYVNKLKTTNKRIVLLSGEVGVGKTYMLKATANEAIKNDYYTLYTTAFDLNQNFLKYHCAKLENKSDILDKYLDCDLLLIDDLGTENILKNVTIEYLYLIINQRFENNKNTIITTNLALDDIKETYDERIISRLSNKDTCISTFISGKDLRL